MATTTTTTNKHTTIKHLVLSGGGLLGISYIGLFKYFEETKKLVNIKSITGCSAGAIFGSLLAIGYNAQQLDTIVKTMIFKEYLTINVDSILNFTTTKGFETGKKLNLLKQKWKQSGYKATKDQLLGESTQKIDEKLKSKKYK